MVLNERQEGIETYLREHKRATVRQLAARFFVSEMTVRRDLREMEKAGYLHRYNGGATYRQEGEVLPFDARRLLHAEEKETIARAVRPYLRDGLSVFVDSSSTCIYIVPTLAEYRDIRIVTNSLPVCLAAGEYHIPCLLAGGDCYERDMCTVGDATIAFLQTLNTDVAFFSSQAIADDGTVTDGNAAQTAVRRTALANCLRSVLIMDESKRHRTCLYTLCHAEDIDEIVYL